ETAGDRAGLACASALDRGRVGERLEECDDVAHLGVGEGDLAEESRVDRRDPSRVSSGVRVEGRREVGSQGARVKGTEPLRWVVVMANDGVERRVATVVHVRPRERDVPESRRAELVVVARIARGEGEAEILVRLTLPGPDLGNRERVVVEVRE